MTGSEEWQRETDRMKQERLAKRKPGKAKCSGCGFRIRGNLADHESGAHHKHGKYSADYKGNRIPMKFN